MKTDDLIGLLAEDATVRTKLGRMVAYALVAGIAISAIMLISTIGMRRDMADAMETARVLFKIGATLVLAIAASSLVFQIGRPAAPLKTRGLLLLVPLALVAAAVIAEMTVMPADSWRTRMIGNNARFCVMFIPVLALAPLVAFMIALRNGAPDNPGLSGAVAGLASGGIAAAMYAWHCADDSPLFVATWYTLAIAIVTTAGYFAGRRLLRW
ncbi:DUF1109 family protein [Rhizobium sp. TH2]|uniref:NrsF family protein n=1 Tax=Rhizobium sp. TH2 TaxID=2775403 RepID=UPI0021589647|nr:NrsF family protein [Rhizobium sp. TH2]UVC07102.1 DUF1109 family protein [Rhizobium sp. TH2]